VSDGPTAAKVCLELAERYGAQLRYGPKEPLMGVLGAALDALGVADQGEFVRSVAVTVGDTIYLPFRVGGAGMAYAAQVALVAHECDHVRQGGDEHLEYWIRYFTSRAHRAEYEARALAVELEVRWRLTGKMPDPAELAARLGWYRVGKRDIAVTAKHLASVATTLAAGGELADQLEVIAGALGR
jgi:hypothetical protein